MATETPIMVAPANKRMFDPDASIVLVGCRGAGKRTLGFIGAMHTKRRLIMDDVYFEQSTGLSRTAFIEQHGVGAFVRRSAEVFRSMLDQNRRRCIIECGLSSLTDDARNVLRVYGESHPIVYVHREREHVLPFQDKAAAQQLMDADQTHRQCANFEYFNLYDPYDAQPSLAGSPVSESLPASSASGSPWDQGQPHSDQSTVASSVSGLGNPAPTPTATATATATAPRSRLFHAKDDFARFLDLIYEQPWRRNWAESPFALNALPPEFRAYSYALRLRLSYLLNMDTTWEEMEAGGDCVEFIVDHWPADLLNVIARQIALIRRKLGLPIVFSVEERPREERERPREERERVDKELLELGLRLNVEYLAVSLQRSNELIEHVLARRGRTSIIGDFVFMGLTAPQWSASSHVQNYERAKSLGCNVVRVMRFCTGGSPPDEPAKFKAKAAQHVAPPRPPLIAFDYSLLGIRLPIQDTVLNPVKPENVTNRRDHLAVVSTIKSATAALFNRGRLDSLQFLTIGSQIAHSITPSIHTVAFEAMGLAHTFHASQQTTLDGLHRLFLSTDSPGNRTFGGATLAAPFKVAIRPYLQLESQHASALGAVNVILPLRGASDTVVDHVKARNRAGLCSAFYGDNTDWSSIYQCLRRALSPRNSVNATRTTGLVIGAGGMARAAIYALIRMGCRHIFIHNRTEQHAHDVARHFNSWAQSHAQQNGNASHTLCHVLPRTTDAWPASFQAPTMIVSCVPAKNADGSLVVSDAPLPAHWLGSPTGGVVVELAYDPVVTPLVAQMQAVVAGVAGSVAPAWVVVDGLEVVSEMAIESYELMTGRMAPKRKMREVCRRAWDLQQQRQRSRGGERID